MSALEKVEKCKEEAEVAGRVRE